MKNKLIQTLLLGATLASGCKVVTPISKDTSNGETSARLSLNPTYYSIKGKEARKVDVHGGDFMFLSGDTEVNAKEGLEFIPFKTGIERVMGSDNLSFIGGLDLDWSLGFADQSTQGPHSGLYETKQQASDVRSKNSGSFVYNKVYSDVVSAVPFIGLQLKTDSGDLRLEAGFPYKNWTEEWGHHRFGSEDSVGKEKWGGFGKRFSLGIYPNDSEDSWPIGLEINREEYDTSFGKIEGTSAMATFRLKF